MIPLLIGAGLGVAKGIKDQQAEKRDRKTQAEMARWSPWTGVQAQPVKKADMMGSIMQGGMAGASMGQMMGGGGAAATTAETGIEAGALGSGGTPLSPDFAGGQFHTPYTGGGAAPNAAADYTSPWMGLGGQGAPAYPVPGK